MKYKDFGYELNIDDEVRLIKYHGLDTNVYIPDVIDGHQVTIIGESCFEDNESMKRIRFPKNLKKIENSAFGGCSKLLELHFPNTELTIESLAVWKCFSLKRVVIPQNVKYIGTPAFMGCQELDTIIVDEQNKNYIVIDDVLFAKNPFSLLKYPEGKIDKKYIVPQVTRIAEYGLSFNLHLKRVLLPKSLYVIDVGSFYGSVIDKLSIPNSVDILGEAAFCCCDRLEKIVLSNSIKKIKIDTFKTCTKLEYIEIPKSVRYLDCLAFTNCQDNLIIKVHNRCYLKNKDKLQLNFEIGEK
ncbi:MAG: leucine-rich repeat domain-containing protein [Erysipelotrichaceae bacterium]|nr:leucine-rich repeat domain-containing protein [Erysipelotrichaceae bacterium]